MTQAIPKKVRMDDFWEFKMVCDCNYDFCLFENLLA